MKHFILILFFFASLAKPMAAQQIYTLKSGEISFYSEAPVENIEAHNSNTHSVLNATTREIAFLVPIRKFTFKKALMQEHFNEKYMESDKYPMASFKGKINETVDFAAEGEKMVTATGKMSIHGVERDVTVPGTLTIKGGELSLSTDFPVKVSDYNITIPQLMFKNIAEVIDVKIRIAYTPYKK